MSYSSEDINSDYADLVNYPAKSDKYQKTLVKLIHDIAYFKSDKGDSDKGITNYSYSLSCKKAKKDAMKYLNGDLFTAIEKVLHEYDENSKITNVNGWPETEEDCVKYLTAYAKMIPSEGVKIMDEDGNVTNWKDWTPWQTTPYNEGYTQKVFDMLCHFYFLISQEGIDSGEKDEEGKKIMTSLQSDIKFMNLINIYNKYVVGKNLDTPDSAKNLHTLVQNKMYNVDELYTDEKWLWENGQGWKSFNEFFYRQMDGADPTTGIAWNLRPIASLNDPNVIVAPAECTFKKIYNIDSTGNVMAIEDRITDNKTLIHPTLKKTHPIGNVFQLLADSLTGTGLNYGEKFINGTFVHCFLSPFDYHRFHTPVAGRIVYMKRIFANTFMKVGLSKVEHEGERVEKKSIFEGNDDADNGYEFNQSRGIIIQDCGENGYVATLPIGMADVSGVVMYDGCRGDDPNRPEESVPDVRGKTVGKGHEFGKFKFGGSDIIMLFSKNPEYFFMHSPNKVPNHFQYGQQFAYFKVERD